MKYRNVYCAGPFFNKSEKAEMSQIAEILEENGYATYLPHRDGIEVEELRNLLIGDYGHEGKGIFHRIIFSMDVYRVFEWSHVIVGNLNGRTPDEGTLIELAFGSLIKKPIIIYKDDWRAPFDGRDNLIVNGLIQGNYISCIKEIPKAIEETYTENRILNYEVEIQLGRDLVEATTDKGKISFENIMEIVRQRIANDPRWNFMKV